MERAEVRPPRNPNRVPESSMTRSRVMRPETDPIMSEEDLAFCVQRFRTDSRVLVMLAVSLADVHTPAQIKNYYQGFHPEGKEILSRPRISKILEEFADNGMLEKASQEDGRWYSRPAHTDTYVAQAGYLADFSRQHEVQLSQLFGNAEASSKQSSPMHSQGGYTHDRIRVLKKLYELKRNGTSRPIPIAGAQSRISDDLSLEMSSVKQHLVSLSKGKVISVGGRSPHGSYQKYALAKNIPEYKGEEIPHKKTPRDWVDEYAQVEFYRDLSTDDAFLYTLQHMEGVEDMNLEEINSLRNDITNAMYNKRRRGEVVPVTNFGRHAQSIVEFVPNSGQGAVLRDLVLTLFAMQREELKVEQEGIKKGKKVLEDRQAVGWLLRKVEADSLRHEANR